MARKIQPPLSVGDYIIQKTARTNLPGKIRKGILYVLFDKKWITETELNTFWPPLCVPDFKARLDNCDKTKLWMH